MRISFLSLFVLLLSTFSSSASALKVDNFVLLDQLGQAHELYYHADASAIVIMIQGNGCQIVRSNLGEYQALQDQFNKQGVEFFMLNANLQDTRAALADEAQEWGIKTPILKDQSQMIASSLKVTRTGEVLVIDPKTWQIVYRGPISDRVDYERQKAVASKEYVKNALEKLSKGEQLTPSKVVSPGCIVNYDDSFKQAAESISYSQEIVPILKQNCTACHIKGGIAPWAMSEYAMVRGFAPMMREVLRTKRMPPWHSDPEIGHWNDDKALSDQDKRTLIQWIEAGAPRGEGEDSLKDLGEINNHWSLGEPDLIIDIPAFEVPASGVVDYQFPVVQNPLDKDVWVIGAAVIPGDPKAVHHILAGSSSSLAAKDDVGDIFENFILTYAPGNESNFMPEGTGVFVPKGGVYQFQMHYTPYGKKSVDRSKLGLYFSDKPPANFYREHVLVNTEIKIPAHESRHEEKAYFTFWQDATIHALFPHSHYRGRSSTFELVYPDGAEEVILSVPNYDFNWQRTYSLKQPINVPAGTRIIHRTIYDNSSKNRGNPAPEEDVYWGLQSEEEMLYGSMGYVWSKETTINPTHNAGLNRVHQVIGYWDKNMDGAVELAELPQRLQAKVSEVWSQFDKDTSGALNLSEFAQFLKKVGD